MGSWTNIQNVWIFLGTIKALQHPISHVLTGLTLVIYFYLQNILRNFVFLSHENTF